jgi:hypothetical protein
LWEITTTDLQQWQQVVATTRVLNMIFTKKPELVAWYMLDDDC